VARTGNSTKDFIAPSSFDFRDDKTFRLGGGTYGAARDTSHKIKAIFGARTANGYHVSGALSPGKPYPAC
jgi:hypothetical protein